MIKYFLHVLEPRTQLVNMISLSIPLVNDYITRDMYVYMIPLSEPPVNDYITRDMYMIPLSEPHVNDYKAFNIGST